MWMIRQDCSLSLRLLPGRSVVGTELFLYPAERVFGRRLFRILLVLSHADAVGSVSEKYLDRKRAVMIGAVLFDRDVARSSQAARLSQFQQLALEVHIPRVE